jgi:5-formyltetrahydrofolate cyclo-ligase
LFEIDKVQHRKIATSKRKKIYESLHHEEYAKRITHFFHEWISGQKSVFVVALYHPVNSEINPLSLIEYLDIKNKTICLPMVVNKKQPLIFKPWHPGEEMVIGHYGISVPDNDQIVTPDLVICPLLAYDSKGMRLGYGGGFYDRTIRYLRRNRQTKYIGLAFSEQKSYHDLPSEDHDVPLDAVLTETGIKNF